MKKYSIFWSKIAENDLTVIIDYISKDNPDIALIIYEKIKKKATNLYYFPKKGRIVPELQDYGILQYRELIISHWRIIYRIAEEKVYIFSVLDSRQNVEDILLKRLIKT